jgi:hypothetical protein
MYLGNKNHKIYIRAVGLRALNQTQDMPNTKQTPAVTFSVNYKDCFIKGALSVVHAIHYDMGIWLWSCGRNELTDKLFYCALMICAVSYWRRPRNISEQLAAGPDWAFSNTTTSSREILCSHGNSQWFITLIIKAVSYSETSINTHETAWWYVPEG